MLIKLLLSHLISFVFVSLHQISFYDIYLHDSELAAGNFYLASVVYLFSWQFVPRLHLPVDDLIHNVVVNALHFYPILVVVHDQQKQKQKREEQKKETKKNVYGMVW